MSEPRRVELTDPRALRAVAHPVRMALLGLLRREGSLTATQAGARVGESPANCSFHLRQLAKWGLVEEAGGGRGRERPWRATAQFTSWPNVAASPEQAEASRQLSSLILGHWEQQVRGWLARKDAEPAAWQQVSRFEDTTLHVTTEELAELGAEFDALLHRYVDRLEDAGRRPAGSRPVRLIQVAVPLDDEAP